jgi:hypothetical protein
MPQERIDLEIDIKTGTMKFDLNGFQGEGCDAIEEVENMLASSVIERQDKDEKYQYQNINPATLSQY